MTSKIRFYFNMWYNNDKVIYMDKKKIGSFLTKLRISFHLSIDEVELKTSIKASRIFDFENGMEIPTFTEFQVLATLYLVDINELMSGELLDQKKINEKYTSDLKKYIPKAIFAFLIFLTCLLPFLSSAIDGELSLIYTIYDFSIKMITGGSLEILLIAFLWIFMLSNITLLISSFLISVFYKRIYISSLERCYLLAHYSFLFVLISSIPIFFFSLLLSYSLQMGFFIVYILEALIILYYFLSIKNKK